MDHSYDCLACRCKSSKEGDDEETRLAVQSGRRLVEEEKQRLRDEFDSDRKTFPLLDSKSSSRYCRMKGRESDSTRGRAKERNEDSPPMIASSMS